MIKKSYKIIVIAIMCIVYSNHSFSQDNMLHYGVKLGIVNSCMTKNFQVTGSSRIGFTGGLIANYDINKMFSVGAEGLYLQQGVTNSFPLTVKNYPTSTNICFNTIEIPLTLCFNPHDADGIIPRIYIGHSFGYIFKTVATNRITFDTNPVKYFYTKEDVTNKFSNIDFGAVIGVGFSFKAGSYSLLLDARYKIGYTNISTAEYDAYSNNALIISTALLLK